MKNTLPNIMLEGKKKEGIEIFNQKNENSSPNYGITRVRDNFPKSDWSLISQNCLKNSIFSKSRQF